MIICGLATLKSVLNLSVVLLTRAHITPVHSDLDHDRTLINKSLKFVTKMDVEGGSVVIMNSVVKNAIVFTDVSYKTSNSIDKTCAKSQKGTLPKSQTILDKASGAIRPGRLTFILGPSGAGKTTLLKILAGRKKASVTGSLYGTGRNAVFVEQNADLIDTLTAGETLQFAASLKLARTTYRERVYAIETVTKQLGIHGVLNTRASRLSGGERKRLTIACELLTDPPILLLDEPTSGLDAVSSISVIRALVTVARGGRTIGCVIHQPSSQLFSLADDVILMAKGRTLFAGAATDLPNTIAKAGFVCPQYYNMADYLLEIASDEHTDKSILEQEASSYAYEMRKIAKHDIPNPNKTNLVPEAEALLNQFPSPSVGYSANICQQLRSLLWRCGKTALRDVYLTQIRLISHLIVALLLGALYNGAGAEAGRIVSNTACIFFFLLFIFFSNAMPTINSFPIEAKVVLQEHLNKWYSLPAYCISKIVVDLPIQLLCATVFLLPAWYLTSQPMEAYRIGIAWVICALVTILAQTFGLTVGAACQMKLALFIIPATNIPMLMFSEFFIPYQEMPSYLKPLASISYFRYAFDALLEIIYGYNRGTLPCNQVFCMFKNPEYYLTHLGLTRNINHDIAALIVWIIILQASLMCVLTIRVYKACR